MPQLKKSESQRPRAGSSSGRSSTSLDLAPLHLALPRAPLLVQQNRNLTSSSPRTPTNGKRTAIPLPLVPSTPKRGATTTEGSRVASISKRPSTAQGSRVIPAPSRLERPKTVESPRHFSTSGRSPRKPGDSSALLGRKGLFDATKLMTHGGAPAVSRLPPDLLCQCFTSVESVYHLASFAMVCRAWREALLSDMVWKTMYLNWWHSSELDEPSDVQITDKISLSPQDTRTPPKGYDLWRSAFIARFQDGKRELLARERARAVKEDYVHIRQMADRNGKRAIDCAQGEGMQKLAEHLGLNFTISINRGHKVKIQGKGKIEVFQSSCVLRYPVANIGNLDLAALKSIEVTATSDRLLRVCSMVELTRLPMTSWEMVSMTSRSPGPLRLLQHHVTSGASVVVGTLAEETNLVDGINGEEQVLLIVVSLHLNDLLWKVMDLGQGSTSSVERRVFRDELDPHFGLHSWHVSVQFHTFGRNIWARSFKQVFWNPRESIPGEKAVFLLVSNNRFFLQHEVFPGVLKLPWKSEAFSGTLKGVYLLDMTLWDERGEIAWQTSSAVRIDPAPLAVVEYGIEFDGERVRTEVLDKERGVNVEINMCIPLSLTDWQASEEKPMVAITNLHIGLSNKFLEDWCGVANI